MNYYRFFRNFEEEACKSDTEFLDKIDQGFVENVAAPKIAKNYYKLPQEALLSDVILCIREDEAKHRDRNHEFADSFETKDLPSHQQ